LITHFDLNYLFQIIQGHSSPKKEKTEDEYLKQSPLITRKLVIFFPFLCPRAFLCNKKHREISLQQLSFLSFTDREWSMENR